MREGEAKKGMELVIFWTGNNSIGCLSIYLTSYLVSIYLFLWSSVSDRMGYFEEGGGERWKNL